MTPERSPMRCITHDVDGCWCYYYEAYQRGATDARAKLLAEVCAWLRTPELATRVGSRRLPLTVADAIEAKFKADQSDGRAHSDVRCLTDRVLSLESENARLREALTRFDQLVEAVQTSHADDGYTDADVQVGKFQDELPALLALAADQSKEK